MLHAFVTAALADPAFCAPGTPTYVWPEPDAAGIPTNAAPFALVGACPQEGADVVATLTDEAGAEVATATITLAAGAAEVLTVGPQTLTAGARYALTLDSPAGQVISGFTAGDADAVALAEGPRLALAEVNAGEVGPGDTSVTVTAPEGTLAIEVYGDEGEREYLESTAVATSFPLGLPVHGTTGDSFCAWSRALDATGSWAQGPDACGEVQGAAVCGLTGASSVSAVGLVLVAGAVARRRR